MKKPLLAGFAGILLITLTATTLYAQVATSGSSITDKMKAVAHAFTLSSLLNPADTGLTSDPIKGKKTGDILTAGEYNRILELVAESNSTGGLELWKCTCGGYMNMVTTQNLIFGETCVFGNGGTAANVQYSSWSCTKIQNSSGSGGGSGWVDVPLTDTADFDTSCEYRFDMDFVADDVNRKHMNSTKMVGYGGSISNKFLFNLLVGDVVFGIPSTNKNQYGTRDSNGVFTNYTNVSVTNIQKRCGGGGGSGGVSELQLSNESSGTFPNFIEATKYCKNLTEGGFSDWRFPRLSELFVLIPISSATNFIWTDAIDYSQGTANANPQFWGKLRMSDGYFSATTGPGDDVAYVRCVRGI